MRSEAYTAAEGCASNGKGLAVSPTTAGKDGEAVIEVPVPAAGKWAVTFRVIHSGRLVDDPIPPQSAEGSVTLGTVHLTWQASGTGCTDLLPAQEVVLEPPSARLTITAHDGAVALDKVTLHREK